MFGLGSPNGTCSICRGDGKLETRIYASGRFHSYGEDVKCEACDGKGYHMTAARAAALPHPQSP